MFAALFLALLAALVVGVFLYARAHYFIGADDEGFVTVYRGLDAAPLGVELNSVSCSTPVIADFVPRANRRALDRRSRTDRDAALAVVRTLYRKQLALAASRPTPDPCTG
ncbi:MAG: hypothetical protein ABR521_04170, partial [Gaiellaceae bacterium]